MFIRSSIPHRVCYLIKQSKIYLMCCKERVVSLLEWITKHLEEMKKTIS